MKFEDSFYRFPFVFILISLIAGILIFALEVDWYWLAISGISAIILFVILAAISKSRVDRSFYISMFAFVTLGYLLVLSREEAGLKIESDRILSCELQVLEFNASDGIWKKGIGRIRAKVENEKLVPIDQRVVFYSRSNMQVGDFILVRTKWNDIRNRNNPGEFDAERYWQSKGISRMGFINEDDYYLIDHKRVGILKEFFMTSRNYFSGVLDRVLPDNVKGVGKAILLGDRSDLEAESRNSFSNAGVMHMLAVSGLHVGIIMVILLAFLQQFLKVISRRNALLIVLLLTWVYAGLTGFSPSVLRAVIMFSIILFAGIISRKANNLNVLCFSATIMLFYDPSLINDLGFQLSYLAMTGIFLLYRPISRLFFFKSKLIQKIWEGTAVGIAAQLFTLPVTLYYFHQFPNYFFISNIGVMALSGIILGLGLVIMTFSWSSLLSKYLGLALGFLLFILLSFVQLIEAIPGSVARGFEPNPVFIFAFYVLIVLLVLNIKNVRRIQFIGLGFILMLTFLQWDRGKALTKNELVVYNANSLIISIKSGENITCFHAGTEKSEKDARRLLSDYTKVSPGVVTFNSLESGKYRISGGFKGEIYKNDTQAQLDLSIFKAIIKCAPASIQRPGYKIISLPYLESESDDHSLDEGAFVLTI